MLGLGGGGRAGGGQEWGREDELRRVFGDDDGEYGESRGNSGVSARRAARVLERGLSFFFAASNMGVYCVSQHGLSIS